MNKNHSFGVTGENKSEELLRKLGYEILERNYRNKTGEIDIIAKHKDTIIFVEVKSRASNAFGGAVMAVTKSKQQKLIKTAYLYLQHKGFEKMNMRFDVITFNGTNLDHIINAFS